MPPLHPRPNQKKRVVALGLGGWRLQYFPGSWAAGRELCVRDGPAGEAPEAERKRAERKIN